MVKVILVLIFFLAAVLRFYRLPELMPFIGDIGWFYLSARDLIINGNIPLVGITSSHTWLHQGPWWTYLLSLVLWISNFNPVSGAYFIVILGILSVYFMYKLGSIFFSQRIGLIATFLYATSPLIIIHSRYPYHTSPIPLLVIFFTLFIYKWIQGEIVYFPLIITVLAVLYNFELATVVFIYLFLFIIIYGFWRKRKWAKKIIEKKIVLLSFFVFFIIMLPILIYDINHRFVQTFGFMAWIPFNLLRGIISFFTQGSLSGNGLFTFSFVYLKRLFFLQSGLIAFIVFIFGLSFYCLNLYNEYRKKSYKLSNFLLLLFFFIPLIGFIVNSTPSEAYLPMLFPSFILVLAFSLDLIMNKPIKAFFITIIILFIGLFNSYTLIKNNYLMGGVVGYGPEFKERMQVVKAITAMAGNKPYNIIGRGEGSKFTSFTMNYEYLTWWLGNPPSKTQEKLKFVITEDKGKISLIKKQYD